MLQQHTVGLYSRRQELVRTAERVAETIAAESPCLTCSKALAPHAGLTRLAEAGLLSAALPERLGGLGLGTEPGGHLPLLRTLAAVGGADLALGRLYEGHVNGLILIHAFGSPAQLTQAADDAHNDRLFGVWNTGEGEPMRLDSSRGKLHLQGCKGFATGAAFVQRPVVTAEHGGWQMTLPRMESAAVADALRLDRSSWEPFGMERSESFTVDFTGAELLREDLIGAPGDFYRDPLFRGGAIRFAAVQAGALLRLSRMFADWLQARNRVGDPYQLQRLGEITLAAQEAALWIERAGTTAEDGMSAHADEVATAAMVRCANMTRLAIERLATATMPRVIAGIGAHGLLRPHGFERLLRDLTMYLRQPNPDGALADVGRAALEGVASGDDDSAGRGVWTAAARLT